jgi:hypothetical protein
MSNLSCMNRGGMSCGSGKCTGYAHGTYAVCTMDKVIVALNGYSHTYRTDELRDLLLSGITGKVEREHSTDVINSTLKLVEDSERFSFDRISFLLATKLEHTKTALETLDFPNFVYYRPLGLTFIDVPSAKHDTVTTALYWLDQLRKKKATAKTPGLFLHGDREMFGICTSSEKFLTEGIGFFSSSVYKGMGIPRHRGYPITMSNNHKLSFQEKQIFDGYGYDPIDEKEEF